MTFEIAVEQCVWDPETPLGTPCRRRSEVSLASVSSRLETQEYVSSVTLLADVFSLRRLSTDLVLLALGDQRKSLCASSQS